MTKANISVVYDIKGKDGLTDKQRNTQIQHTIDLYTLVEVNLPGNSAHGLRLFVQEQNRDCDGTPLYSLTSDPKVIGVDMSIKSINERYVDDELSRIFALIASGSILDGYSEYCLTVVEDAESVKRRIK